VPKAGISYSSQAATTQDSLLDFNQPCLIGQAVCDNWIAIGIHVHVAHNISAAGDRPALELIRARIETHNRIRFGRGFTVPQRALGENDTIRLGLRSTRRRPFLDRNRDQIVRTVDLDAVCPLELTC
jgi:hypothetical protein